MLVANTAEAIEKARFWAIQARDKAKHYQHSEIGYNYRLSNVLAGIGRGQLQVLDERIANKRKIFAKYFTELSELNGIGFMPEAVYGQSSIGLSISDFRYGKIYSLGRGSKPGLFGNRFNCSRFFASVNISVMSLG